MDTVATSNVPASEELGRPGMLRIGVAALGGLALGGIVWLGAVLLMSSVGLTETYRDGHDLVGWPFPVASAWSVLSNLAWLLLACSMLSWGVRRVVRSRLDGWDVRLAPLIAATALGWFGVLNAAVVVAFVLIAVVVQRIALVRSPAPRLSPRSRVLAGAGLVVALLTAISYQPLHPLAINEGDVYEPAFHAASMTPPRAAAGGGLSFSLHNLGTASVRLTSVEVAPHRATALVATIAPFVKGTSGSTQPDRRLAGAVLERGDEAIVLLKLRSTACGAGQAPIVVRSATVRFRTLGLARSQRFDLEPPSTIRCQVAP